MTFRWFGPTDPIPLAYIRQIPGVTGVVSAVYETPVGDPWPRESLDRLAEQIDAAGLSLAVIESIPVHEDIKLGRPSRDRLVDGWCESVAQVGAIGVPVVCYNFMPVFDWMRSNLAMRLPDGSTALAFDDGELAQFDLSRGTRDLPGWAAAYDEAELRALVDAYRQVPAEQLWENLAFFLERVVPAAESAGVRLAIHPDDPPWSIFGLPRIVTSGAALERLVKIVDSPANGVTVCTGSLGADPNNDVPAIIRRLGGTGVARAGGGVGGGRIHFMHCRNVKRTGAHRFHESPHPSAFGNVDMLEVMRALREVGYAGPVRPDHGRMIWGETGRPGYGLYDRALGAMYLQGLWEAVVGL
jgi:mannonate dehydratase